MGRAGGMSPLVYSDGVRWAVVVTAGTGAVGVSSLGSEVADVGSFVIRNRTGNEKRGVCLDVTIELVKSSAGECGVEVVGEDEVVSEGG